jgi:hypothetical protein
VTYFKIIDINRLYGFIDRQRKSFVTNEKKCNRSIRGSVTDRGRGVRCNFGSRILRLSVYIEVPVLLIDDFRCSRRVVLLVDGRVQFHNYCSGR